MKRREKGWEEDNTGEKKREGVRRKEKGGEEENRGKEKRKEERRENG